ncbi:hypothetical protein [Nibricoccus sp. IMCC34717]|uniref:hypothetical protein n=1 Tax=Nibricoccus sp. IMCC34717 TaxID=3034021 RepID=UPI003850252D
MSRNLLFALLALCATPAVVHPSKAPAPVAPAPLAASFSALPKFPHGLTRAPTTWSSRAMLRWEARFGDLAVYPA